MYSQIKVKRVTVVLNSYQASTACWKLSEISGKMKITSMATIFEYFFQLNEQTCFFPLANERYRFS